MRSVLLALSLISAIHAAEPVLVPMPKQYRMGKGAFPVRLNAPLRFDPALEAEAKLFAEDLKVRTNLAHQLIPESEEHPYPSEIRLDVDPKLPLAPGGYRMQVTEKVINIRGKDAAGVWYATRSLLQMLPPAGDPAWKNPLGVPLDAISITDEPRFGWRGMMLDVSRHFRSVEEVKQFIDWLSFHKMNRLHWHLSDDQGWRVEIRKYPELTKTGGWRKSTPPYGKRLSDDGQRYGGFYTQDQIREVVAYAKVRHVTVMPEIDMPGHMAAAITAYPHLGNSDIPGYSPEVVTRWGVFPYILAPKEETFQFVDDVLTELCELFPSEYIHIGGDEAPKDQWDQSPRVKALMEKEGLKDGHEVQSYFIKRVEKILKAKGRRMIGWDEIREGGLSPEATVMSWRGEAGGVASAKEGHDVVMASNTHLYFDHYQRPGVTEIEKGLEFEAIGGFQPLYNVYSYDPLPKALTPEEAKHVLGVQAQLWSEYMKDWKKVEYMAFPRIAALAEISWTPVEKKNYGQFRSRLAGLMKHYAAAGVNYAEPYDRPEKKAKDGVTFSTTMTVRQENWPELMYDGRMDTFFWAERGIRADDTITVVFPAPLQGKKARIITGGAWTNEWDILEAGVMEVSADGKEWKEIGTFGKGTAGGTVPDGTTQIRARVTAAQEPWIMFRELVLE